MSGGTSTGSRLSLEEVLDDAEVRFIMNLPPNELASADRLFFQLEQAWWWYEDFVADADETNSLPHFTQQQFAKKMMGHSSLLRPLHSQYEELFQKFKTWRGKIPLAGCIIVNPSRKKLLLVKNWKGGARTLPRGKINEGELSQDAAARETLEETGFDPALLIREKDKIETHQNGQKITMFIVPGVSEKFPFNPRVRKEISDIEWFSIDRMPKNTYNVFPFIKRLKDWIEKEKNADIKSSNKVAKQQCEVQGRTKRPAAITALSGGVAPEDEDEDEDEDEGEEEDVDSESESRARSAPVRRDKPLVKSLFERPSLDSSPTVAGGAKNYFGSFAFDVEEIMSCFG